MLHVIVRLLGGITGLAILVLFCNAIIVEGRVPVGDGYYGPIMFPMGVFLAIAFLSYAIGGNKLLSKFAPSLAGKQAKDSAHAAAETKYEEPKA